MKKTTKASKDVKVANASDIVIKSKDNRKVSTIDKVANGTIKGFTMEKATKLLANAHTKTENATREKAKAFYAIKSLELYKPQFETFKDFINSFEDGMLYGVKYNQASNLANIWHYVWCDKVLSVYDSNKATSLVAYVKKDYAKVVALHNSGTISENMKKSDIVDALKKEFGSDCKTVKEGKSPSAKSENSDLMEALAMVGHFIKKNAVSGGDVSKAWDVILKHCEQ